MLAQYTELPNAWIPLSDGRKLSARIWLPQTAKQTPVPAILEYLPYRKRDGTAPRDESTYPVFAANGYAGVRVDIAGTGESDGAFDDEYSPRELQDGVDVINWIAIQPWSSGDVGLMGISWGGFNSLQIAALNPKPLKATIAIGTVVDRYNKDIHYKDGCHLYSNYYWANMMLCYNSRPPDPLLRDDWREVWINRLNSEPWLLETWLSHQRRDSYWEHGSICEEYPNIKTPSLVISGWADLYVDAPVSAIVNIPGCKAINGPWIHKYPHVAWPKPRMDFHREALQWWDRWLKNIDNEAEKIPDYRAFISENTRPASQRLQEQGRWVREDHWPSENINEANFRLGSGGALVLAESHDPTVNLQQNVTQQVLDICSPQDCGTMCGEIFTLKPDSEMAGDQRLDDSGSLVFNTELLEKPIEFLGSPRVHLRVAIDQLIGNLAVRLVDVHPDGVAHRITWGVLNLAHRNGNKEPENMHPGQFENVTLTLNQCGYRVLAGHRLRLSVSTAYWPMILPPPCVVTASIDITNSTLTLPLRTDGDDITVAEPEEHNPLPVYKQHLAPQNKRSVVRDLQHNETHYHVMDDSGEEEMPDHGLRTRHLRDEKWSISPDDPLTSRATCKHTYWMSRSEWSIRTECDTAMTCDNTHYHLQACVKAFENEELINERTWETSIERDFG